MAVRLTTPLQGTVGNVYKDLQNKTLDQVMDGECFDIAYNHAEKKLETNGILDLFCDHRSGYVYVLGYHGEKKVLSRRRRLPLLKLRVIDQTSLSGSTIDH